MIFITKRRLASLATASAIVATLAVAAMPSCGPGAPQPIDWRFVERRRPLKAMQINPRHPRHRRRDAARARDAPSTIGGEVTPGRAARTFRSQGLRRRRRWATVDVDQAARSTTSGATVNKPDGTHTVIAIFYYIVASGTIRGNQVYKSENAISNNAPGDPRTGPIRSAARDHRERLVHLQHEFKNDGGGLAVEYERHSSRGQSVATWTLRTETDAIGGDSARGAATLARQRRLRGAGSNITVQN